MNFHADVRWHNFANIILFPAHLWNLYYFHDGKIGHFDDLFFYNARTISHLIAQRESHKSCSYRSRFNHTDLESWLFRDILKCLLMFYIMNTEWPCHENPKMLDIEFCEEFDEGKSDFSLSNFSHVISWQYCSFRLWLGNQRISLKHVFDQSPFVWAVYLTLEHCITLAHHVY